MRGAARRLGSGSRFVRGFGTSAGGLLVAAAFTYVFLSVAGRMLGPDSFASLSTLWAMTFIIGPGLFLPLQQELGRLLAAQRQARTGGAAIRRAALVAAVMAAPALVSTMILSRWLTDRLFGGDSVLLGCFATSVVTWAVAYLARGVLTGAGDFGGFARLIAGEAVARIPLAGLLAWLGVPRLDAFGVALALAPLVSVLAVTRCGRRLSQPAGVAPPWTAFARALGWLVVGSLLAQFLANAGPVAVQLLARPDQRREAGVFLSALVIARLGFYLFQAAQAAILPNLAEMAAHGSALDLQSSLRRLTGICTVLVVLTTAGAFVLGPLVVRILFGPAFLIGSRTIALLACASSVYVMAAALNSAAIAANGHVLGASAWLGGSLAFCLGTTVPGELFLRVEVGYLAGTCVAAGILLLGIPRVVARQGRAGPHPAGDIGRVSPRLAQNGDSE